MGLEAGMTKQGVRDLNSLGPRKTKPGAGDAQRGEGGGEPAREPQQPVAETPAVVPSPAS